MHVRKHTPFKIWAEIFLAFFVLQSTVIAECDSLYVEIEENCYWEKDIQFLKDLIANSDLTIEPLILGTQTWTNGRLTYFYTVNTDLKGEIPLSIGNLNELTYFYSYGNKFTGSIPDTVKNLTSLTSLAFEYSDLTGTISESLSNLTSLTKLSLIGSQLSGTIPETISNLTNLTQLNLSWNDFSGEIPSIIGTLSNLTSLDLSGNNLSGSIPSEISNLTMIENLWLGDNDLSGDIPSDIGNMANLKHLRLTNNNFGGDIPSWVFNITNLEVLELNGNAFTGSIPSDIGNLKNLKTLELANNQLTGSIPAEIGSMSNLKSSVSFSNNQLSGSIPPEIGNLKNLERLYLNHNQLSGEIPPEIGDLDSLKALWLNDNQLTGQVPETICTLNLTWGHANNWDVSTIYNNQLCPAYPDTLYPTCVADYMGNQEGCSYEQNDGELYLKTDLQFLKDLIANRNLSISQFDLGSQQWKDTRLTHLSLSGMSMGQSLKGEIPQSVGNLTKLESLKSDQNKFTGTIPDTMKHLTELTHLKITNGKLSGEIPQIIGNLKKLEKLELYLNNFTGSIPDTITTLTKLTILNLGSNQFNDSIPKTIGNLTKLNILGLSNATLIGKIPSGIGNLGNLNELWLNNNSLSGTIPDSITSLRNLTYLRLDYNQLTGSIPETIGNLSKLEIMGLEYNQLSGEIPPGIGNLGSLKQLWLRGNQLTGLIPETIGNLNSLNYLSLRDNQLTGSIPEIIGNLNSLTTLSLSGNQLTGSIPETIGNLSSLISLWLDNNQLIGPIPDAIGNLNSIKNIYLMNNQLTGTIPETIGNLTNLKRLFLYSNQVTGIIPEAIGDLKNLNTLYLSNNELTGAIPITIGDLPKLTYLILTSNQLSGTIPEALGNLTKLTVLELLDNKLSGAIPDTIGNLTDLTHLELGSNKLTGKIPEAIGNLTKLASLKLSKNQLRGLVPTSLCNLSSLQTIELNDNNLCPSYPECLDASSIGNQDISKCHFPDIYDLSPDEPISGQMVTLTGINFGSPFDATTVNFYQNETVTEGFLFKTPSIETELFVRIPSTLATGICTTRVSVLGDSMMTSWPFSFNVKSVPDGPVLRKVYKNFGSGWVAVNTITAEDTILVSGYGIDTNGGTVFLSKDGKMLQGTNLATQSDPVFGIAPQVVVPTGLGTGQVEITVSTVVNGTESELSDKLVINYIDNYVFVNSSNSEGPWLGTEESPYNNIQAGIDAVSSSGTVLVYNGTYLENINFIGKGIKLGSLYMTTGDDSHISSTIIDGNQNGSVVSFINNEDTSSVLTGFTIQNGSGTLIDAIESHGGGIYCKSASPYLKNLNIIENSATHLGGGIYCSLSANPIISDIIISGNKTLDETTGQGGGLFCWFSAPELNNVLMVNNSSIYGGGAYLGGEGTGASFTHVTIVDNIGTYGGGFYLNLDDGQFTDQPTVLNSIIWNNKPQQIYFTDENNPWGIDISYSIIEGGKESISNANNATINWGAGNITSSPILTSNYRLDPYSPAIGAASSTDDPQTDLNGGPRPNPEGSLPDIGAYESVRALRLLRTSPILDGLIINDISLWNDEASLSAHWKKFENNSAINYEYAIGTYDVNNIADWQSSGSDTFITVTGLNLEHDSTYFFNIIGTDTMGRVSKTSTSNGVLIDIIPPSIISADIEWTALNPVLGDLKLQLNISEPVVAGLLNMSSSQGDQYELEYNLIKEERYEMTISGPFIGGDEISIKVTGLQDRAGTIASDTVLTYPVGYLSDYNVDGLIDASDLSKFVTAWQSKDFQYELGPTVGKVPFLKPDVDGQFDIYDAAAFTRMWHWSVNKSGKMIPRYYVNSGKNLTSKNENQTLMITVSEDVSTMNIFFEYPKEKVRIQQLPQASFSKEIVLSDLDTLNGEFLITAGYLEPKLQSFDVPYIIMGKDDVMIKATYRMFDTSGEIFSQGTKEITLKPVPEEFALHQNYPNPFNPVTTINYDLPQQTHVDLFVYDIMGREVVKLIQEEMPAGYQSITWNARNSFGLQVSAGIYFFQIQTSDFVKTKKMVLLK
jgi:predicted outer membrane repeat protein